MSIDRMKRMAEAIDVIYGICGEDVAPGITDESRVRWIRDAARCAIEGTDIFCPRCNREPVCTDIPTPLTGDCQTCGGSGYLTTWHGERVK